MYILGGLVPPALEGPEGPGAVGRLRPQMEVASFFWFLVARHRLSVFIWNTIYIYIHIHI